MKIPPYEFNQLLADELVKWIHERRPTIGTLVGELCKAPSYHTKPAAWMKERVFFDANSWHTLKIHERKYYLRKTLKLLVDRGIITKAPYHSVAYNQKRYRLEVPNLLDILSAAMGRTEHERS